VELSAVIVALLQQEQERPVWSIAAIAATVSIVVGLLGSGFLAKLLRNARNESLRETFMTKEDAEREHEALLKDIQGVSGIASSATHLAAAAMEKAAETSERTVKLEQADRLKWRPIADTLQEVGRQMQKQGETLAAVTATNAEIARRLEALERRQTERERGH